MEQQDRKRSRDEIGAELAALERALKQQKVMRASLRQELDDHPETIDALMTQCRIPEDERRELLASCIWRFAWRHRPRVEWNACGAGTSIVEYEVWECTVGHTYPSGRRQEDTHHLTASRWTGGEWECDFETISDDDEPARRGDEPIDVEDWWERAMLANDDSLAEAMASVAFFVWQR